MTMVGQFLQWALLAVGVGLTLLWYQKKAEAGLGSQEIVANFHGD